MHALHVLDGLNWLKEEHVLRALRDKDATVREHAVRLSEKFIKYGAPSEPLRVRLQAMAADSSINVRYQLAFTLGEVRGSSKILPLASIARQDMSNSWMQAAILSSLAEGSSELFAVLSADRNMTDPGPGREFLRQLVRLIGTQNDQGQVGKVLAFVNSVADPAFSVGLVRALGDGEVRAGGSLAPWRDELRHTFDQAATIAADPGSPLAGRDEAVRLLGPSDSSASTGLLLSLLEPNQPQALQLTAF